MYICTYICVYLCVHTHAYFLGITQNVIRIDNYLRTSICIYVYIYICICVVCVYMCYPGTTQHDSPARSALLRYATTHSMCKSRALYPPARMMHTYFIYINIHIIYIYIYMYTYIYIYIYVYIYMCVYIIHMCVYIIYMCAYDIYVCILHICVRVVSHESWVCVSDIESLNMTCDCDRF